MEIAEVLWGLREVRVFVDGREIIVPYEALYDSPPMDFDPLGKDAEAQIAAWSRTLKMEGLEIAPNFMEAVDRRPLDDKLKEQAIKSIREQAARENLYVQISADFRLP